MSLSSLSPLLQPAEHEIAATWKVCSGHLIEVHQLDQDTRRRLPSAAVFWHRTKSCGRNRGYTRPNLNRWLVLLVAAISVGIPAN